MGVVGLSSKPIRDGPIDAPNLTELTGDHQLAELLIDRVGALVEHGCKNLIQSIMGGNQPESVRLVNRDGLFDKEMQAGLQYGDSQSGVVIVRSADEHGIDLSRAKK